MSSTGTRPHTLSRVLLQYEDVYRLCFIRGPEGIIVGLAQPLKEPQPELFAASAPAND
jgi:hypothetical protein